MKRDSGVERAPRAAGCGWSLGLILVEVCGHWIFKQGSGKESTEKREQRVAFPGALIITVTRSGLLQEKLSYWKQMLQHQKKG